MRKSLTAVIAVLLLLVIANPIQAAPEVEDQKTISLFKHKQNRIGETVSWRFPIFTDDKAGEGYGQSIIIPGPKNSSRVVVTGDNHLNCYEIPPLINAKNKIKHIWKSPNFDTKQDSLQSHTTYDPKDNLLITGTSEGWLYYYDADKGKHIYSPTYLDGSKGIVSAPLATYWENERVIVAGSQNENIYIITNFSRKQSPDVFVIEIGNSPTSSPSPLPNKEGFVIGGKDQIIVIRFNKILEKDSKGGLKLRDNPSGYGWDDAGRISEVATSFAAEGYYAYFSDKYGTLYKYDTENMRLVWVNRDFASEKSLVNQSPAFDDKYVYFVFEQNAKIGPQWEGSLVVLDKDTGKVADPELIPKNTVTTSSITTAPIVTPDHVYVGTKNGQLLGWHKEGWLAAKQEWYDEKSTGKTPEEISEITIAQGLMVLNTKQEKNNTVTIYATGDTNLYVKDLDPGVVEPESGKVYTGTVTFGLDEQRLPEKLAEYGGVVAQIGLIIDGQQTPLINEHGNSSSIITLKPNAEETLTFNWQAKDRVAELVASINLERTAFIASLLVDKGIIMEPQLDDNKVYAQTGPNLPDFYIKTLSASANQVEPNKKYAGNITVGLKPAYKKTTMGRIVLTYNDYPVSGVNGKLILLKPGQEQSFDFYFVGTNQDSVLYARVEPANTNDAYWPNNEKTVTVEASKNDLAINIVQYPSRIHQGEEVSYVARITSKASEPIKTSVRWDMPGSPVGPITRSITIPANSSVNVQFVFTMFEAQDQEQLVITAEINPSKKHPADEVAWNNNKDIVISVYEKKELDPPGPEI